MLCWSERFGSELGVHLVGIGGAGQSGLARLLMARGHRVTGSDLRPSRVTDALASEGVCIHFDQRSGHLPEGTGVVVASAAIPADQAELKAAKGQRLPVMRYAQALGMLMAEQQGVAICGTHGKTTTTTMVSGVLWDGGKDPSWVIGGQPQDGRPSARAGAGEHFVAEACEFGRSFLNLAPRYAILTNLEADHLDYYRDVHEIVDTFATFTGLIPKDGYVLVNGDDRRALEAVRFSTARVETFGFDVANHWQAVMQDERGGRPCFEVRYRGQLRATVRLQVPGRHNAYNALAACALGLHLGVPRAAIEASLARFGGVQRRFEILHDGAEGPVVVDDYAHHPTELQATLQAARTRYPDRRLVAVFQPHQHSRTRLLLDDFAIALQQADEAVVMDIYACRDRPADRAAVHGRDLAERVSACGIPARYLGSPEAVERVLLERYGPGHVLLVLGAGTCTQLAHRLGDHFSGRGRSERKPMAA